MAVTHVQDTESCVGLLILENIQKIIPDYSNVSSATNIFTNTQGAHSQSLSLMWWVEGHSFISVGCSHRFRNPVCICQHVQSSLSFHFLSVQDKKKTNKHYTISWLKLFGKHFIFSQQTNWTFVNTCDLAEVNLISWHNKWIVIIIIIHSWH